MSEFDPQTPDEIADRLARLRVTLAAREGRSEFKVNVPAIRAEIARLEAL